MMKPAKLTAIDRLVSVFSPAAGLNRARGRMAMQSLEDNGYVTPGSRRKAMKGVTATDNSPLVDMSGKLRGSRALSRDLAMNAPVATATLRRARTNIAGGGLVLQSRVDRSFLGLTEEQATAWERQVEREFDTWARSKNADYTGAVDFWDMQGLAVFSALMNGDVGFMLPWAGRPGWPWEMCVKLVEADLIRTPDDMVLEGSPGAPDIVGGVEHVGGRISAYHVANFYPGDHFTDDHKFQKILATDSSGRRNFYLLTNLERVGQRRGMPFLAPVLEALKQITRLSEAELMAALVSSFFTVFIKDQSGNMGKIQEGFVPEESVGGGGGYGPDSEQREKAAGSEFDLQMGHGSVVYLDDDKDITVADPKRSNEAFAPFFTSLVEQVSAACEIPPEVIMLKFSSSYSAARGALLEAWKFWRSKREWLARNFCQPVFEAFLEESILKGRITAPGFFEDAVIRAAWSKAAWIGPGMGQIDPLKEAKAAVIKIQNNLATHEEEYMADRGGRWESAMERKAREKSQLQDLGLALPEAPAELVGPDGAQNATGTTATPRTTP